MGQFSKDYSYWYCTHSTTEGPGLWTRLRWAKQGYGPDCPSHTYTGTSLSELLTPPTYTETSLSELLTYHSYTGTNLSELLTPTYTGTSLSELVTFHSYTEHMLSELLTISNL